MAMDLAKHFQGIPSIQALILLGELEAEGMIIDCLD
jgi:hypothetical protein